MKKITTEEKLLLQVLSSVALKIAKMKKPFTVGEKLTEPYILDVVNEILGLQAKPKLEEILFSDNAIERIIGMACSIKD